MAVCSTILFKTSPNPSGGAGPQRAGSCEQKVYARSLEIHSWASYAAKLDKAVDTALVVDILTGAKGIIANNKLLSSLNSESPSPTHFILKLTVLSVLSPAFG